MSGEAVSRTFPRGWLRIFARWAKGDPCLSAWEVDFLKTIGTLEDKGRLPSMREAEIVRKLAYRLGYTDERPASPRNDLDEGDEYRPTVPFETALRSTFELLADRLAGPAKDPELSRLPYWEYLQTPHWKTTKARALLRAGGICKRCHATGKRLDVHHLSYDRLGREAESDLKVLCSECHAAEHRKDYGYQPHV
jgi:5-methylcytosine-specific restriction endonuclease McrA